MAQSKDGRTSLARVVVVSVAMMVVVLAAAWIAMERLNLTLRPDGPAEEFHWMALIIPDPIEPDQRAEINDEPIDEAVRSAEIGEVIGGGRQLTPEGITDWVSVDLEVTDPERALPILTDTLRRLGAPPKTRVVYGDRRRSVAAWPDDDLTDALDDILQVMLRATHDDRRVRLSALETEDFVEIRGSGTLLLEGKIDSPGRDFGTDTEAAARAAFELFRDTYQLPEITWVLQENWPRRHRDLRRRGRSPIQKP